MLRRGHTRARYPCAACARRRRFRYLDGRSHARPAAGSIRRFRPGWNSTPEYTSCENTRLCVYQWDRPRACTPQCVPRGRPMRQLRRFSSRKLSRSLKRANASERNRLSSVALHFPICWESSVLAVQRYRLMSRSKPVSISWPLRARLLSGLLWRLRSSLYCPEHCQYARERDTSGAGPKGPSKECTHGETYGNGNAVEGRQERLPALSRKMCEGFDVSPAASPEIARQEGAGGYDPPIVRLPVHN